MDFTKAMVIIEGYVLVFVVMPFVFIGLLELKDRLKK
jgi:hypothetical protein